MNTRDIYNEYYTFKEEKSRFIHYVLVSLDTFKKYRYSDIRKGRTEVTEYDYDRTQYSEKQVTEKIKLDRLKYLSLFVAETPEEIKQLIEIFPDLESVRLDINEYLERPKEVLSMFSEALRILDRNTAELMVDRMKDEMDELKVQKGKLEAQNGELEARKGELEAQNEALKASFKEKDAAIEAKDAEIERLKKLLEEQNK
jgi:chromosome segregation ATPase